MPAYRISFNHSAMKPDFRGSAVKHANTPEDAAKYLGKFSKKDATILDKRFCTLSNVVIEQI
jgi:hypothetical protein